MGRHGGKKSRFRAVPAVLAVIGLVAVIGLGVWWWSLRDTADPIDADPQRAYAVVVDSRPCTDPNPGTTVELQVAGQTVRSVLDGCGHRVDQRLAVEYLNGHPEQVRLAGTSATPASSMAKRLLPIGILAIGAVAAVAAVALIREKRKPKRAAGASGTDGGNRSVAQMREAITSARASAPSATTAAVEPVAPAAEPAATSTASPSRPASGSPPSVVIIKAPKPPTDDHPDLFGPDTRG